MQKAAFRDTVAHDEVREFTESAYFAQLEQAREYAAVVTRVAESGRR